MISLAIPHYNNSKFIVETLDYPITDIRISEIIICDDKSVDIENLKNILKDLNCNKIKLVENTRNLGVYLNKLEAVKNCSNEWTILFDSDNILDKSYIDILFSQKWDSNVIFSPSIIEKIRDDSSSMGSYFDYTPFIGAININNFFEKRSCETGSFDVLLNTCNYFIPVKKFILVAEENKDNYDLKKISSLDSLTIFTDWIANGKSINVVKDLGYKHRIHQNSTYLKTSNLINQVEWTGLAFEKLKARKNDY